MIILKILGWILLILVALLLAALLCLLFIPIRYRVRGKYEDGQDPVATARVSWFLRIVQFQVNYKDGLRFRLKLFGKTLMQKRSGGDTDEKNADVAGRVSVQNPDRPTSVMQDPSGSVRKEVPEATVVRPNVSRPASEDTVVPEMNEKENVPAPKLSERKEKTGRRSGKRRGMKKPNDPKKTLRHRLAVVREKLMDLPVKLRDARDAFREKRRRKKAEQDALKAAENLQDAKNESPKKSLTEKLIEGIRSIREKVNDILLKIQEVLNRTEDRYEAAQDLIDEWYTPEHVEAVKVLYLHGEKLFLHILPKNAMIKADIGFEDPSLTGYVLAAASQVGYRALQVEIRPFFDREIIRAYGEGSGRIYGAFVLVHFLRLYRNREFRALLKQIRSSRKHGIQKSE